MVNRIFVERKPAYANEARALCAEIRDFLGIAGIRSVRIINRYDVEGVSPDVLEKCVATVFSEPQVDDVLEAARFLPPNTCPASLTSAPILLRSASSSCPAAPARSYARRRCIFWRAI